jgi:hypothetical protein
MALDAKVSHLDFVRAAGVEELGAYLTFVFRKNATAQATIGHTRGTISWVGPSWDPPLEIKFKRGNLETAKLLMNRIARDASLGADLSPTDLRELHGYLDLTP